MLPGGSVAVLSAPPPPPRRGGGAAPTAAAHNHVPPVPSRAARRPGGAGQVKGRPAGPRKVGVENVLSRPPSSLGRGGHAAVCRYSPCPTRLVNVNMVANLYPPPSLLPRCTRFSIPTPLTKTTSWTWWRETASTSWPATRAAPVSACLPSPSLPLQAVTTSPSLLLSDNEGWFEGTSHNTGTSGLYPGNYVEKTKESDCWLLHRWVWSAGCCMGGCDLSVAGSRLVPVKPVPIRAPRCPAPPLPGPG